MQWILAAVLIAAFSPAAAEAADDGFGGPYFTAQAPAALGDHNDAVALSGSDSDAAAVAAIEPAAGGDVFKLPADPVMPQDHDRDEDDYDAVE